MDIDAARAKSVYSISILQQLPLDRLWVISMIMPAATFAQSCMHK
jgi:hypothetical protein